jgi:ABC-type transport system substrate-binding protein
VKCNSIGEQRSAPSPLLHGRGIAAALGAALVLTTATPAVSVASTVHATPDASASASSTLTFAETVPPSTLDPQASNLQADRLTWSLSYQCLLTTSSTGAIEPLLATSYSVSHNGLVYTFNLRHGVSFQNGEPFTSADVVYTFTRLFTTGSPSLRAIFPTYASVSAPGTYTVQFHLKSPDFGFIYANADPDAYACNILSKTAGQSGSLATKMVGTGPWAQVAYQPDSYIKVMRFANYWGPKAKMANLELLYVPESTSQITDLEAGTVDMMEPTAAGVVSLAHVPNVSVKTVPSDVTVFLEINEAKAPFNNLDLRRAVAVALDRSALAQVAYAGAAVPSAYVPPNYSWGSSLKSLPYSQYNPAAAKRLLAAAGYPHGLAITLSYISNYEFGTNSLVAQMASELNAVGFKTTLTPMETASWLDITNTKQDYQLNWNEQSYYSDPYLYVNVPSRRVPPPVMAPVEALQQKILSATSVAAYEGDINALQREEATLVYPTITLLAEKAYVAYRTGMSGINVGPSGSLNWLAGVVKG